MKIYPQHLSDVSEIIFIEIDGKFYSSENSINKRFLKDKKFSEIVKDYMGKAPEKYSLEGNDLKEFIDLLNERKISGTDQLKPISSIPLIEITVIAQSLSCVDSTLLTSFEDFVTDKTGIPFYEISFYPSLLNDTEEKDISYTDDDSCFVTMPSEDNTFLPESSVFLKDGKAITTSTTIAKVFQKRHDNVLRDIQSMNCSNQFRLLNFEESSYPTAQHKVMPMYELTKDGFTLLVMGYTGDKAMKFKEAYITAFNAMEKALSQTESPILQISKGLVEALKVIDQDSKIIKDQTKMIAEFKPKVEAYDKFIDSEGNYTLTAALKASGFHPRKMITYMKSKYIDKNRIAFERYIESGFFTLETRTVSINIDGIIKSKSTIQTKMTPKGMAYFQLNRHKFPKDVLLTVTNSLPMTTTKMKTNAGSASTGSDIDDYVYDNDSHNNDYTNDLNDLRNWNILKAVYLQ